MANQSKSVDEHYEKSPAKQECREYFANHIRDVLIAHKTIKKATIICLDADECLTVKCVINTLTSTQLKRFTIVLPNNDSQGHCNAMKKCIQKLKKKHPTLNVLFSPNTEFVDALKNNVIRKQRCLIAAFADFTATYKTQGVEAVDLMCKHGILLEKGDSLLMFTFSTRNVISPKKSEWTYSEAGKMKQQMIDSQDAEYIHINSDLKKTVPLQPYHGTSAMWLAKYFCKNGDRKDILPPCTDLCLYKKRKRTRTFHNNDIKCEDCHLQDNEANMLLCDRCNKGYHTFCLKPKLNNIPEGDWFCASCCHQSSDNECRLVCKPMLLKRPSKKRIIPVRNLQVGMLLKKYFSHYGKSPFTGKITSISKDRVEVEWLETNEKSFMKSSAAAKCIYEAVSVAATATTD